jgi:NAD(P)-dependent dehydrogenase (short-subunit alcohol dehydrogenase family)
MLLHRARSVNLGHFVIVCMKRVAAEIAGQEPRIDVLINNAGAIFASRRLTEDGVECTFALNHMAYFAVTEGYARGSWPPRRLPPLTSARSCCKAGRSRNSAIVHGVVRLLPYGDRTLILKAKSRRLSAPAWIPAG